MEITANAIQTVLTNQNVYFTETVIGGGCSISHREGSGLITLRGNGNQSRPRYKISFGGNIAVPTGETVGPVSLAIALEGEGIAASTMTVTPAAVENYFNVFSAIFVDVPRGCCVTVSIQNTTETAINVQNANLIVERVA
jgi:hypothetical protein